MNIAASIPSATTAYRHLDRVNAAVLNQWPAHRSFIEKHLACCDATRLEFLDVLSQRMLALIGDELERFAADYKWMCGFFLKYEIQYRRNKGVEHTSFDAILERFYKNDIDMGRYMRGLMVSQVLWRQHAGAAAFFAQRFLPMLKADYDYLEIGPGHGLWLSFAASDPKCKSLTGWDVAQASLGLTRHALSLLGITRPVSLELGDICTLPKGQPRFDAAVISQVLELVSEPGKAVQQLADSLRPGGLLFVNCPTQLVAPDHIRLWADYHEVDALMTAAGLKVVDRDLVAPDATLPVEKQGYSYVAIARKG